MPPPVPLSMLLTKDVPYEWHDAVALVAQLVAQVRSEVPAAQSRIPDLRGVTLEEGGILSVSVIPDQTMPAMPGASQMLQQLLSGKDQPAQLRLFAMQAATAEPTPTLDAFAEELAKWERPGRPAKLGALYHRALDQIGPAALTEEARAREEKALATVNQSKAASPVAKPKKKKTAQPGTQTGSPLLTGGLVIIVLALVAGGAAWYTLRHSGPATSASAPGEPDTQAAEGGAATDDTAAAPGTASTPRRNSRRPANARTPAAVTDAEMELTRARALFEARNYEAASSGFNRVLDLLGGESSPQAEEIRKVARSLSEVARAAVADAAAANLEYRSGDDGVTEPVPLSYLPPRPGPDTPADKLQVLELHIKADGSVESAKFVMNRPSFRNSWWTSAAKAWHFTPAMKNGKPVRFVMRIVMDDNASQ